MQTQQYATARTKPCEHCGQVFERDYRFSHRQWEERRFCSSDCQHKAARQERPLCACGCGQRVNKLTNLYLKGHGHSRALARMRYQKSNNRWYVKIAGRWTYRYRAVMEQSLGRPLRPDEVVHHINGDSSDDRIENLELFATHGEHMRAEYDRGSMPHLARGPAPSVPSKECPVCGTVFRPRHRGDGKRCRCCSRACATTYRETHS